MLDAVAHLPHSLCAHDVRGLLEAANDGFHRAVANRVEARLDTRSGARGGVVADLAGSEVSESAGVQVGVGRAQAGCVRADRPIREKVAGRLLTLDRALGSDLPALLALLDAPVDDTDWDVLAPP